MDTCVVSLRLLAGDQIATVAVVGAGHADGIIWNTHPDEPSAGGGARHPLLAIYEQFAREDRALVPDGAAPPLEILLDRLEALLL